jgi:hypothetical protein
MQHMRPARLLFVAAVTTAAFAGAPALAAAAPPANDNYLASIPMALNATTPTTTIVDTTEATTQPDLFNPNRDGQVLGGGDPEPLACKGVAIGKTVWYDLAPPTNYGVALRATAAFAAVVAVYEWNPTDSKIKRLVDCTTNAVADDLLVDLDAKKSYTIQVGGAAGVGGPVTLKTESFPDSDNDGVLDALDKCVTVPGVERYGGCPPKLDTNARLSVDYTASGVTIKRLWVEHVPKGAKIVARCGGCGSQTVRAQKAGTVSLTKLLGRSVSAGKTVAVSVTMAARGSGTYKFGATGRYRKWPIKAGALGATFDRCLNAKSSKIERCK